MQIAIDGPVGAGKSTIASELAKKLHLLYIDTGAMYRAVALAARRKHIDWNDKTALGQLVKQVDIKLKRPVGQKDDGRKVTVILDDEDISWKIRNGELGEGASVVSQYPAVRQVLVKYQQQMAIGEDVVMEGRDIGTRVLPHANLKIYMDADLKERILRKQQQLQQLGHRKSKSEIRQEIVTRDTREMTREVDPLRPAKGAWILDTTDLSVEAVVDKICHRVKKLHLH